MQTVEVVIDLETLDNAPTAAVIAIGAKAFFVGSEKPKHLITAFMTTIRKDDAMLFGTVSSDTLDWWQRICEGDSDEAVKDQYQDKDNTAVTTIKAAIEFRRFLDQFKHCKTHVWGNGATFDLVILKRLLDAFLLDSWSYRDERCFRTIRKFAEENMGLTFDHIKNKMPHFAYHDAEYEAAILEEILKNG